MQQLLQKWHPSQLIDIGGNIGFYSLAAAAIGSEAVIFEPSPLNVLHMVSSLRRNGFRGVRLNTLCVSDAPSLCAIGTHGNNQGALRHNMRSYDPNISPTSLIQLAASNTMAVAVDNVLPPQHRNTFVKLDIEGGECAAFRGMRHLLNHSTNIVGVLVEFDKSFACCKELVSPSSGGFWMLEARHGLCAFQAPVARPVHTTPTPLAALCKIRPSGRQLNLRWERC